MNQEELKQKVSNDVQESYQAFASEISTDENKDYRRGFLAGRLFAQLQLKADLLEDKDASSQQPTD